jgi:hypothetical protein
VYKKHHPPNLKYEVWRLEKIGKDGAFHKKLTKEGITTIQEFLKLSVVDPQRLFFFDVVLKDLERYIYSMHPPLTEKKNTNI